MNPRNMFTTLFAALLAATAAAQDEKPAEADKEPAAETMAIEGKDGKTLQAEVLSADDDSVQIRRADGKEFDLPFARLSDKSVKEIRDRIAAREKAAAEEAAAKEAAKPVERIKVPQDPKSPAELAEKVVVKKGSNVIVTFTEAVDGLTRPVIVEKEPEDAPFFRVSFTAEGDQTIVTVTSTYEKTVLVRCIVRDKDPENYYTSSIQPLDKGIPNFETWSAEVEELVLYDFRYEPKEEEQPAEAPPEAEAQPDEAKPAE
jgi:hypothetical protein